MEDARQRDMDGTSRARQFVVYGMLGLLALLVLFPFYWLILSAFKSKEAIFAAPPQFYLRSLELGNFNEVFEQTRFFRSFFNSVFIAVLHCTLTLFLSSLAGYAFAVYPHAPGRERLFAFVLATMMIPGVVTLIPVFTILTKLQLVNTYTAMIVPGAANAFGIFWMRQSVQQHIHPDLLDAARIDGCSEFGLYWRIALPLLRPALAALGILVLIGNWNNLMWAFIVLRTDEMYTLPLMIYLLQGEMRTPYGQVMAASLLATLPLVIAFLLFQRQFIQGIAAGAIKS
ncbi:MAG: carbohydrate ABC transporter permease [Candidatus Hydrogenedentes bacterium]|nr:carbohydrate ABC transporter permease [Candidatus Hydrogenedentota bacterium]